jgi:ubiquinone biosynthesis protein
MLGKTLLNLDQVGRTLAPQFDPNASIRRNAAEILRQRVVKTLSPGNLFSGMLEAKRLGSTIARTLEQILRCVGQ